MADHESLPELLGRFGAVGPESQIPRTVRQQREAVVGKYRLNPREFGKDVKCRFVRGEFQVHDAGSVAADP